MKKQFIAAALAVMVSSSLLITGCSSSNTETKASKTSVTFEAETEPASGQVIFEEDTQTVTAGSQATRTSRSPRQAPT